MAVVFNQITFHNRNGIDEPLTVEAPIGQIVYSPTIVPAHSSVTINVQKDNCASALIKAGVTPHADQQTFGTAPPTVGPLSSFLESLVVWHVIGSPNGRFTASTSIGD